jgi:hypothetical protein
MALTLTQVQTRLTAAWEAVELGQLELEVNGRQIRFHSLEALQKHIDWLRGLEVELQEAAEADSGGQSKSGQPASARRFG